MSKTKKIILGLVGLVVILLIAFVIYMTPAFRFFMKTEVVQMDSALTIVIGGGGNSGVLLTDSAVVVIDTKMGKNAEKLAALAKEKAGNKKIIVINTHYHGDHTSGNFLYPGSRIIIGAYDTALLHKSLKPQNQPNEFVKDSMLLALGEDTLLLINMGQAHTYNDMVVILKNRRLLFSGDLIFYHVNPVLKKESGADVDKWILVLDRIIKRNDCNKIIPGHGIMGGKELPESLKKYFEDMKRAAADPALTDKMESEYKSWTTMPAMANPEKTIKFIKEKQ